MRIIIILSNKYGPNWAIPGFQSPAHVEPILSLMALIQLGPCLLKPSPYPAHWKAL